MTATVVADSDVSLVIVSLSNLLRILEANHGFSKRFLRQMATSLAEKVRGISPSNRSIRASTDGKSSAAARTTFLNYLADSKAGVW